MARITSLRLKLGGRTSRTWATWMAGEPNRTSQNRNCWIMTSDKTALSQNNSSILNSKNNHSRHLLSKTIRWTLIWTWWILAWMVKWLELMDQFRLHIIWLIKQSNKLIKGARAKLQIRLHLSQRILRQTKTIFSPSQDKNTTNCLQKPLKLKLTTKSLHPNPSKKSQRRRKQRTLAHFIRLTPSRCTPTA